MSEPSHQVRTSTLTPDEVVWCPDSNPSRTEVLSFNTKSKFSSSLPTFYGIDRIHPGNTQPLSVGEVRLRLDTGVKNPSSTVETGRKETRLLLGVDPVYQLTRLDFHL